MGAFNVAPRDGSGIESAVSAWNRRRIEPLPKGENPPMYFIFNVGPFQWTRANGVIGTKYIRACKEGDPYNGPTTIRKFEYEYYEAGNQTLNHRQWDGKELTDDILGILPPAHADNDLTRMGVFVSLGNPPAPHRKSNDAAPPSYPADCR